MPIIIFLFLVSPFLCFGQQEILDSSAINKIVDKIDKLGENKSQSFSVIKKINNKSITENWVLFDNKQFSRIVINYTIDSNEYSVAYTEKYYTKNGLLMYAEEREIFFMKDEAVEQGTTWAGGFYFSKGKLIDHITLGHGKSESDNWDPENEILVRMKKRKAELKSLK